MMLIDLLLAQMHKTSHIECQSFIAGIGKALFALYMLYRLALKGQRVVYHKHGDEPLLFCAGGAFQLDSVTPEELRRSDTWWVLAAKQQSASAFQTLCVGSLVLSGHV